jgi:thiamine transport system permease protein
MTFFSKLTTFVISLTLVLASVGLYLHPGAGSEWSSYFDQWLWNILEFSIVQAMLSASLSVALAVPFAIVFSSVAFKGQWLLKGLLNLFFIMPVLTIILGVVSAYSDLLNVFSLKGILIAHMYLNVPYAIRIFWERLSRISDSQYQLADTLGFSTWRKFVWIKSPVILEAIQPIFVLIFLLCFSSFTVVLTMGGGPANTNLEVAIYQALKFDFDPRAGVIYALIHGSIAFFFMWFLGKRTVLSLEVDRKDKRKLSTPNAVQLLSVLFLLLILLYPIVSLFDHAFSQSFTGSSRLWDALVTSVSLAVGSSLFATILALCRSFDRSQNRIVRFLDFGLMVLPIMVISTGLFLWALKFGVAFKITIFLIIWLNGLMAMPLIIGPLQSRIQSYRQQYEALANVLNMTSSQKIRWIYLPSVAHVLPWSFVLAMVLSMGDLGVAALLGSAQFVTLPILIYQAMGSYQMVLASQLTLLLLIICSGLLLMAEWLGDRRNYA